MISIWAKDTIMRKPKNNKYPQAYKQILIKQSYKIENLGFIIWRTFIFVNLNENLDDCFRNSAKINI